MRIRIHKDLAKSVNANRKGKRSANQEVNMALAAYYLLLTQNKKK